MATDHDQRPLTHRFCIAPMLDWSDRHARFFWRQLSRHARVYTEMITTSALLYGERDGQLPFDPAEHPIAAQLGGSEPAALAQCGRWAEQWGYDEVNLNVGCPSDRVQSGRFGACLMAEPQRVADCVRAMHQATSLPITVKHRIGIDQRDSYGELCDFIGAVAEAGCSVFIIHARKAWLQGLSPKQNREIPPLNYAVVHRVKQDFPALQVVINGGLDSIDASRRQLAAVDGVMLGRSVYQDPWLLADVDRALFAAANPVGDRASLVENMLPYIDEQLTRGARLHHITRPMLGLCNGLPGARAFRRLLSEQANRPGADGRLLLEALSRVHLDLAPRIETADDAPSRAPIICPQPA